MFHLRVRKPFWPLKPVYSVFILGNLTPLDCAELASNWWDIHPCPGLAPFLVHTTKIYYAHTHRFGSRLPREKHRTVTSAMIAFTSSHLFFGIILNFPSGARRPYGTNPTRYYCRRMRFSHKHMHISTLLYAEQTNTLITAISRSQNTYRKKQSRTYLLALSLPMPIVLLL